MRLFNCVRQYINKPFKRQWTILVFLLYYFTAAFGAPGEDRLRIHFVDVGQGDAILLESGGRFALMDSGSLAGGVRLAEYLRTQKTTKLDFVMITHLHQDHVGGLFSVLAIRKVNRVYWNGFTPPESMPEFTFYHEMKQILNRKKIPLERLAAGQSVNLGRARINVLWPAKAVSRDLNRDSLVTKVVFGRHSILLAADINQTVERALLKSPTRAALKSDILKVGHHASAQAASSDFLKAVQPKIAVVSVGENNRWGYPCPKTIARIRSCGARLVRTDRDGTLILMTDGKKITIAADE